MDKEIVLQKSGDEISAAVFEGDRLMEYYLERNDEQQLTGNIYKARVENVLPGMQAAFVDIGLEKNAYLHAEDIVEDLGVVRDVRHLLRSGQEILVQVIKEAVGTKGPRVSCKLSLPGRFVVFLPNSEDVGISRKIADEAARERVKAFAKQIRATYHHGVIIRTCAEEATMEQLEHDYQRLALHWDKVAEQLSRAKAPSLVHRDTSLPERILRDIWTEDVSYVVVDDEAIYHQIQHMLRQQSTVRTRLRLMEREKIEMIYNLRAELDKTLKRRIWLKNGGYLVIDQTEALSVIDVNTGKFVGKDNLQQTIVQMNLEAAAEIARQIRLRNLGGIIIVDFIDMLDASAKEQLVGELRHHLEQDRVKTRVLGLTGLGLVEITRKKTRVSLAAMLEKPCPYCDGKGRILSEETVAVRIRQELTEVADRTEAATIAVTCHPLVAAALIGENSQKLSRLQKELHKEIVIQGRSDQLPEAYTIQAVHETAKSQYGAAPVLPREIVRLSVTAIHNERGQDGIGRIEGFVVEVQDGAVNVGQELLVEIEKVYATYALARKLN